MVDIREIMQSGNARLERLLERIANNTKGVYKAANTFILETIDRLAETQTANLRGKEDKLENKEQVAITSKLLTAVILEAFNQFRKRRFKADVNDFKDVDFDSEEADPSIFPDSILTDLTGNATKYIMKDLENMPEEMIEELIEALQSKAGQNFARYAGNLTMFYLVREAPMLAEADKREERTEINVPPFKMSRRNKGTPKEVKPKFDSKFQEMNKSWFNGLRK